MVLSDAAGMKLMQAEMKHGEEVPSVFLNQQQYSHAALSRPVKMVDVPEDLPKPKAPTPSPKVASPAPKPAPPPPSPKAKASRSPSPAAKPSLSPAPTVTTPAPKASPAPAPKATTPAPKATPSPSPAPAAKPSPSPVTPKTPAARSPPAKTQSQPSPNPPKQEPLLYPPNSLMMTHINNADGTKLLTLHWADSTVTEKVFQVEACGGMACKAFTTLGTATSHSMDTLGTNYKFFYKVQKAGTYSMRVKACTASGACGPYAVKSLTV